MCSNAPLLSFDGSLHLASQTKRGPRLVRFEPFDSLSGVSWRPSWCSPTMPVLSFSSTIESAVVTIVLMNLMLQSDSFVSLLFCHTQNNLLLSPIAMTFNSHAGVSHPTKALLLIENRMMNTAPSHDSDVYNHHWISSHLTCPHHTPVHPDSAAHASMHASRLRTSTLTISSASASPP